MMIAILVRLTVSHNFVVYFKYVLQGFGGYIHNFEITDFVYIDKFVFALTT